MKRWLLKRNYQNLSKMAQVLGVREATACVLANRGIHSSLQAQQFLQGGFLPGNASLMKDFEKGIQLIAQAIREQKKIVVYGDYDVDGVMSSTILYRTIRLLGGNVTTYVPHRQKEGYGLNEKAVETLAQEHTEVLFTCDNGIAAAREVALAKEKGMTVVVLDHHEPPFEEGAGGEKRDILPEADAVIDPKQKHCAYPFSSLCAAGIAYRFAVALLETFGEMDQKERKQLMTFAAIATVCDIVDLLGENREMVRCGIHLLEQTENLGLQMLIEETGLAEKKLTEYHMGFIIGPCINATGRLESAAAAVELFCTEDPQKARADAKELVELNAERKQMTAQAAERAILQAEEGIYAEDRVLVLYDPEIHESIAGIVAGRVKDRLYRPTLMITNAEDGAKGSARSIEGYDIFQELSKCKDLFTRFGGHAMAAGFSLPVENIGPLRERLNAACTLTKLELMPVLRIEKELSFSEIDLKLAMELKALAPFGKGNPVPLFGSKNILVERFDFIGASGDILRMTLREEQSGTFLSAIRFDGKEDFLLRLKELYSPENYDKIMMSGKVPMPMDFVYSIDVNTYNGRNSVQLMLKDFRWSK